MGLPDAYPFAISAKVRQKLEFVAKLVAGAKKPAASVRTEEGREAKPGLR
jgi:hypothetical protein